MALIHVKLYDVMRFMQVNKQFCQTLSKKEIRNHCEQYMKYTRPELLLVYMSILLYLDVSVRSGSKNVISVVSAVVDAWFYKYQ